MSNALAIAAVTTTLRSLLEHALGSTEVSTKPPDKARNGITADQINIFLYQMAPNAALRNTPMPQQSKPGETGLPPLALTLYYLITAYGQNDDDSFGHRLLGRAMGLLHDHPLLGSVEIRDATLPDLPDSDLHLQIERVRITLQPMTTDEMSKLWTTFQTQYRLSVCYQVSVVLLESTRPTKTPLPVLGRGSEADTGIESQSNLTPPLPLLFSVDPPRPSFLKPHDRPALLHSAIPGDTLTITGLNLGGTDVSVRVAHPLLAEERVLTPLAGNTDTEVKVVMPDEPADLPAGYYTVAVELTRPGETFSRLTNRLPFALAPDPVFPVSAARDEEDKVVLEVECRPEVRPEQRASLMLGDREILASAHTTQTGTLTFEFDDPAPAGGPDTVVYRARLRVDGVDSLILDREAAAPAFLDTETVTIIPPAP